MNFDIINTYVLNNHGLKLATQVYRPSVGGRLPVVIILHGFTGYKEEQNLANIAARLSSLGFVTLRFTSSGFGDSEGTLDKDYRYSSYFSDLESVYQFILTQPYIDNSRIGLCGHSMGGRLALLFAAQHPELKAICAISPILRFVDSGFGNRWEKQFYKGFFEKISSRNKKMVRIPNEYLQDADQYDVLNAASLIQQAPVLVMAGDKDRIESTQNITKIYEALITKNKKFLLLHGIGHFYKRNPSVFTIVHDPLVQFFRSNL